MRDTISACLPRCCQTAHAIARTTTSSGLDWPHRCCKAQFGLRASTALAGQASKTAGAGLARHRHRRCARRDAPLKIRSRNEKAKSHTKSNSDSQMHDKLSPWLHVYACLYILSFWKICRSPSSLLPSSSFPPPSTKLLSSGGAESHSSPPRGRGFLFFHLLLDH